MTRQLGIDWRIGLVHVTRNEVGTLATDDRLGLGLDRGHGLAFDDALAQGQDVVQLGTILCLVDVGPAQSRIGQPGGSLFRIEIDVDAGRAQDMARRDAVFRTDGF